jgi:hypothetical protein
MATPDIVRDISQRILKVLVVTCEVSGAGGRTAAVGLQDVAG